MALKKNIKIKVLIIGSGNIAWHILSHLSFFKRFELTLFSRTPSPEIKQLQKEFKVNAIHDWKKVTKDYDIFFICTPDSIIPSIAQRIKKLKTKGLVVHTSGTVPLKEISKASKNCGVFYPLQTFTYGQSVNWLEVPVFIEGSHSKVNEYLESFAGIFSNKVVKMNSQHRLKLHLAAVIAGNFSNAMYSAAYQYLSKELVDPGHFNYLIPLIVSTAKKTRSLSPIAAQTGPAARKDKRTQKQHLQLLKEYPDLRKIYRSISKLIEKQQKSNAKLQGKTK
jgi:predicted short-subunit dehydrogenase-like oxidoreductase (DUF2520 family)